MKFNNEEEFRGWIVAELPKLLGNEWMVLQGKNVADIVLCYNGENRPLILFIEAKYHKTSHGRIHLGGAKGRGFQVEFLIKRPLYIEKYLRWIVADQDSERCLFFNNADVRENCAGEIKQGKHNNFTNRLFEKSMSRDFDIGDAPRRIADWAKTCQD